MLEEKTDSYLEFYLGKSPYCVALSEVARVFEMSKIHPLAFAPQEILGIAHIKGRLMTVLDLELIQAKREIRNNVVSLAQNNPEKKLWAFNMVGEQQYLAFCVTQLGETLFLKKHEKLNAQLIDMADVYRYVSTLI